MTGGKTGEGLRIEEGWMEGGVTCGMRGEGIREEGRREG